MPRHRPILLLAAAAAVVVAAAGAVAIPALLLNEPSLAPPGPAAAIEHPANRSTVEASSFVDGTASRIPSGWRLWLVISAPPNPSYYPPSYYPQLGPLTITPDGHFRSIAYFGTSTGIYQLQLVLFDSAAERQVRAYFANVAATGTKPRLFELPGGTQLLASVEVIRRQRR